MIGYLPTIYPDELVYSWFCRYFIHSGCIKSSEALRDLLNKRCNNPSKEFIGQLNPEAKQIITQMYSIKDLILNHTMFPQYARFISKSQKQIALTRLENENVDAHHLFTILPRGIGEEYLKYCPVCVSEDRKRYGETYWHREHQIRGINICVRHNCKLKDSAITSKSEQTFTLCAAELNTPDIEPEYNNNPKLLQYAEYLSNVFNMPIDFTNDVPLSAILYHGMKDTPYMKSTGRCRYTTKLTEDINRFYTKIGINNIASIHQVTRTILGYRFDFSITCQIAFFIGVSVKDLAQSNLTSEKIEQEKDIHNLGAIQMDWSEYDLEMLPVFEETAKAIYDGVFNENNRPERVGVKTICKVLNISEHRIENMPKCKAVLEKYTESYGENFARRIVWAYEKLKNENPDRQIYWSDIRVVAGVKKHNFDKAKPYFYQFADEELIQLIQAVV